LAGADVPSETFLVVFEIIDVVLVAALVAAVMLARRESGRGLLDALRSEVGDDT
jgi:NADH-quinone oxidoreductase subunit J